MRRARLIDDQDRFVGEMWIGRNCDFIVINYGDAGSPGAFNVPPESLLGAIHLDSMMGPRGGVVQIKTQELRVRVMQGRVYFALRGMGKEYHGEDDFVVFAEDLRKVCKWAVKKPRKGAKQLKLPTEEFVEQSLS